MIKIIGYIPEIEEHAARSENHDPYQLEVDYILRDLNEAHDRRGELTVESRPVQVLRRCLRNNLVSVLICLPVLGFLLSFTHDLDGYDGIQRLLSAMIGLSFGWIAGLGAAWFVVLKGK